jgi:LysM repeat protein
MRATFSLLLIAALLAAPQPSAAEEYQEITVAAGDTLWSIANKYLKDPTRWPDIVKHNNLTASDPTVALPGSKLRVPVMLIKEEYRNALLVGVIPEVRYKRKGGNKWDEAKKDMTLKYEDSLRTMTGAQARVRFPSKEVVQINENSYVVLRPEKILQEIQLLQGDVRASRAKVIMPGGTVVQPKGGNSDYQAKVRQDETEVIFVYKGKVDVTAQGKTVTVPEGFGTTVPKSAPPLKPMPLTDFHDFNPAEMTTAPTSKLDVSQGVVTVAAPEPEKDRNSKSRSMVSGDILAAYRLQISADDKFQKILLDKKQPTGTSVDIKKQPIPDGKYFVRVAFIDALGGQGKFSMPSEVIKDASPPVITNLFPVEGQRFTGDESYCDVIGTAEGAALIAVNDEVLFLSPEGRFNKFILLKEGVNVIKIVARDTNGNETVINRKVTYVKGPRADVPQPK